MQYPPDSSLTNTCMIGTWAWGTGSTGGRFVFGRTYDRQQLCDTFHTAYQAGFTLWDTAEVYGSGTSEQLLGSLIKDKNVTVSTKHFPKKTYTPNENRTALMASLARLGRQQVDLYWLHAPRHIADNMKELAQLQQEGWIRHIGLSNGNVEQIRLAQATLQENGSSLTAIQNHYSLLSMEREADVLAYCQANGLLFYGYMILEQGALSGHYDAEHPFPFFSMRGFSFSRKKFRQIQPLIDYIRRLSKRYGIDSAQVPTIWAVAKGVIPIIGLTRPHHAEALQAAWNKQFTEQELTQLETLARQSGVTCKGAWE